jgi:hypothetical protein
MPAPRVSDVQAERAADAAALESQLRLLFHRLSNQLGIILAQAELLEAKSADEANSARAAQVVASVLDAMTTAKTIRHLTEPASL